MRPDFRSFIGGQTRIISHSAKGSEWEDHKYIKKIDGNYYYPDNYQGGRHLDDKQKENEEKRIATNADLDEGMVETMARDVIRGLFGNGADRKERLGENYQKIQDRVNEILRDGSSGKSEKLSDSKELQKKGNPLIQNTVNRLKKNNMRLDEVYSVYKKKGAK